jgi:GNAT superfamily N-acetyltransferase
MTDTAAQLNRNLNVRAAQPTDTNDLFNLIQALADYENLLHQVTGNTTLLGNHLFNDTPYIEAILAECADQAAGFALFFPNYSTLLTQPGLYLEDLFVLPDYRGKGVGKALLQRLAKLALERQYSFMEWSVLDWNAPAIAFYQRIGADLLDKIRICRLTGDRLLQLAKSGSTSARPAVPEDVPALFDCLTANATYHQSLPEFVARPDTLAAHLFGAQRCLEAIVVERDGRIAGSAFCFYNYSTFLTKPGIYIEDLFVHADYRRQGIGRDLLIYLARQVLAQDFGRLEWFVQIWNESAIAFYQHLGATILDDWRICRLNLGAIEALAEQASDACE